MNHTIPQRIGALSLSLMIVACGATRHAVPGDEQELDQFVLILRASHEGQFSYTWQRAEDFELSRYRHPSRTNAGGARVVHSSGRPRDCHAEFLECIDECMSRPLPRGYGHMTSRGRKKGGKAAYCRDRCWQPYRDCQDLQDLKPQEFTAVDDAVDWVKRNREAVVLGSVIVIAGVVFVVVSAGAGLLVLVPAVLLASTEGPSEPCAMAVSP